MNGSDHDSMAEHARVTGVVMHSGELRECRLWGTPVEHHVPDAQPIGTDSGGKPLDLPEVTICMVCERLSNPDPKSGTYGDEYQATLYELGQKLGERIDRGDEAAEQELVMRLQGEMDYEYRTSCDGHGSHAVLVAAVRLGTTVRRADDLHRRVTGKSMAEWLDDRF